MTTIAELPIFQTRSRYNELKHTRYIFSRNYQELQGFISHSEQNWFATSVQDPSRRHELLETARLVHNFLAAAMMLKDHSNRIARKVFNDKVLKAYENKAKECFENEPICGFMQELRNYTLHRNLPVTGWSIEFSNITNSVTTSLFLDKAGLLQWEGWKSRGKTFLKNQPNEIPIKDSVDEYYRRVKDFHKWMEALFESTYGEELKSLSIFITKVIEQTIPPAAREESIRQINMQYPDLLTD